MPRWLSPLQSSDGCNPADSEPSVFSHLHYCRCLFYCFISEFSDSAATCFIYFFLFSFSFLIIEKPAKNARSHLRVNRAVNHIRVFVVPLGHMTGRPEEFPRRERVSPQAVFFHLIPEGLPVCAYRQRWNGCCLCRRSQNSSGQVDGLFTSRTFTGLLVLGNGWVTLHRRGIKLEQKLFVCKERLAVLFRHWLWSLRHPLNTQK